MPKLKGFPDLKKSGFTQPGIADFGHGRARPGRDATVSSSRSPEDHGSQIIRLPRAFAEFQDVLINRLYEVLA